MIETLRLDAAPLEYAWTCAALIGLLIGLYMLRETWLSLAALRRAHINGSRRREGVRDFRTGLAFVLIFLVFAEIGIGALFSPPPVYSANQRVGQLLGWSLVIVEPALVLAKWANWRDQRASLGGAHGWNGVERRKADPGR